MANSKAKSAAKAKDAKVIAAVDKYLAAMATVMIGGAPYTPVQIKTAYQAESDAIDATDSAHATWQQKVAEERAIRASMAQLGRKLRAFVLTQFGEQALVVLGDFDLKAPKSTATTTVATKALAVAKSKATREARGTKGSRQKKGIVGNVGSVTLSATPAGAKVVATTSTETSPATNAPASSAPAGAATGSANGAASKPSQS